MRSERGRGVREVEKGKRRRGRLKDEGGRERRREGEGEREG